MYCICIDKNTREISVVSRAERETMLSVLLDLKQPITSWVIATRETKDQADKFAEGFTAADDLLKKIFQ